MTKLHFVRRARKDYPEFDIKRGDSYYWWKFRYGSIHKSKTKPSRSQLTQSPYYSQIYSLQDNFSLSVGDDIESIIEDLESELENIKEECEESLENMPEQLQDGSILQERIESLDDVISDLDGVEFDIDEGLSEEEIKERTEEIEIEISDCLDNIY